jgi:hypothetical protein
MSTKSEAQAALRTLALESRGKAIAENMNALMPTIGLPKKILRVLHRGAVDETESVKAVRSEFGDIAVLGGRVGTGKSIAAAEWLRAFVADPRRYVYSGSIAGGPYNSRHRQPDGTWVEDDSGDGWYPSEGRWQWKNLNALPVYLTADGLSRWPIFNAAAMDLLIQAPRLVIDDIGTEGIYEKGATLTTIGTVLSNRIAEERPTIITTNLNQNEFAKRYGERIGDRIWGHGRFFIDPGESLRAPEGRIADAPCAWDPKEPWWVATLNGERED